MKKFLKKIIGFILVISLILLVLVTTIPLGLKDTISMVFTKTNITKQIVNCVSDNFSEIDDYMLSELEGRISNSAEINKITDIYINTFIYDLTNNTTSVVDISNEIESLLNNNINIVPKKLRNLVINKVKTINFNNVYDKVLSYAKSKIDPNILSFLIIYEKLTSISVILLLIFIVVILISLILYINNSIIESLSDIGIPFMVSGGILIVILFSLKVLTTQVLNIGVNFLSLGIIGFLFLVVGFVLLDIYDKKTN